MCPQVITQFKKFDIYGIITVMQLPKTGEPNSCLMQTLHTHAQAQNWEMLFGLFSFVFATNLPALSQQATNKYKSQFKIHY